MHYLGLHSKLLYKNNDVCIWWISILKDKFVGQGLELLSRILEESSNIGKLNN